MKTDICKGDCILIGEDEQGFYTKDGYVSDEVAKSHGRLPTVSEITYEKIENWLGSDNMEVQNLMDLLVEIATNVYPVEEFKKDVRQHEQ